MGGGKTAKALWPKTATARSSSGKGEPRDNNP